MSINIYRISTNCYRITTTTNINRMQCYADDLYCFKCCFCGIPLTAGYMFILKCLEEKNLLPKNYKYKCCTCFECQ